MKLVSKKYILPFAVIALTLVIAGSAGCVGTGIAAQGWSGIGGSGGRLYYMYTVPSAGGFLGCGANPAQSQLLVLNAADGGKLNTIPLGEATISYGTPVISGEFAYVTGYNGKVYKINVNSGGAPASVYLDQDKRGNIIGSAVVADGRVFIASTDGSVYALNAGSLDKVWSFATGDKIWSTPAVAGGTVYVGSFDKKVYAIDAASGQEKWSFDAQGAVVATPVVAGGTVYVASLDRHVYALDASDGSKIWQYPADGDGPQGWFWATPLLSGSELYAPNTDGKVYVINTQNGTPAAGPINVTSSVTSSPVMANNVVIVATEEGQIYTIDAATKQLGSGVLSLRTIIPAMTPITANSNIMARAALSVFSNRVYVHTTNPERVFEFDPENGQAKEIGIGTSTATVTAPTSTTPTGVVTVTSTVTVTTTK